jgi:hypothetical protein
MIFRCWRCGTWGLRIKHVCGPCLKHELKEVRILAKELEAKRNG